MKKQVKPPFPPPPSSSPPPRTEVEKCVLLISPPVLDELTEPRSSGSHFSLCFLPHLILVSQLCPLPPPGSPGKPEFNNQRPCATGHRGTQAHLLLAPLPTGTQKKKEKKAPQDRKQLFICGAQYMAPVLSPAWIWDLSHSLQDRVCPVQRERGKRGKTRSFTQISDRINNGGSLFSLKQ